MLVLQKSIVFSGFFLMSSQMRQINFSCTQIIKWYLSRALVKRSILECTPLVVLLAIVGIVSDTSYMLSAFADKDPEDYDDIEDLSKDIDDGDTDDNSVDWDDFKNHKHSKLPMMRYKNA
jgi:hypothetical protein